MSPTASGGYGGSGTCTASLYAACAGCCAHLTNARRFVCLSGSGCQPGCQLERRDGQDWCAAVANEPVSTFAAVKDSTVLDGCLHAGAHAAQHTATVGPDGHIRKFHVHVCKKEMSMAELYPVFAAHAMEWAIMGRDNAWWSVITDEKYKDNNQDLPVHVKDEFFASGKCVGLSYTLGVM
eukprot:COSAG01_NODE_3772_length_5711_cov_67.083393_3_plen_180_part_00